MAETKMPSYEHEFDASDNESFSKLSGAVRVFATLLFIYGVIIAIAGLWEISAPLAAAIDIGRGILDMVVAGWLWSAGTAFRDIVLTEGNDVMNLMYALRKLRTVYTLWAWLIAIACILTVLAIFLLVGRSH